MNYLGFFTPVALVLCFLARVHCQSRVLINDPENIYLFPTNISARYRGTWKEREDVTKSTLKFDEHEGSTMFSLKAFPTSPRTSFAYVQSEILVRNGEYSTDEDVKAFLEGIYWTSFGKLFLWNWEDASIDESQLAAPSRWGSISALEKLIPEMKNQTKAVKVGLVKALNDTRTATNRLHLRALKLNHLFTECDLFLNASLQAPSGVILRQQQQASGVHAQQPATPSAVRIQGSLVSESCNFNISIDSSDLLMRNYLDKQVNYISFVTFIAIIQVLLVVKQMRASSSSAMSDKLSTLTIGSQAMYDSFLCLFHLTAGFITDALFNSFASTAFLEFILFSLCEMKLLLQVWRARHPEAFAQGWERMRRELSLLYARFYGFLLLALTLMYQIPGFFTVLVFLGCSFWIPQIIHNAWRDTNKGLLPAYIIGMTLTRLAIPLYVWGCPVNFMNWAPRPAIAIILSLYMLSQALVLLLQDHWGARFFIPKQCYPKKYDYYRARPRLRKRRRRRFAGNLNNQDVDLMMDHGSGDIEMGILTSGARSRHISGYGSAGDGGSNGNCSSSSDNNDDDNNNHNNNNHHHHHHHHHHHSNGNHISGHDKLRVITLDNVTDRYQNVGDDSLPSPSRHLDDDVKMSFLSSSTSSFSSTSLYESGLHSNSTSGGMKKKGGYTSLSTTEINDDDDVKEDEYIVSASDEEDAEVCPICYCEFEDTDDPFDVMITPCNHFFHSQCLMQWLEQKMECPTCRGKLPAP